MELIKNSEKIFFDKFKPSPIPILFIPFNQNDDKCNNCGNKYSETLLFKQKYCRECLLLYITDITDNYTYLDIHISTINSKCNEHETIRNEEFYTRNIKKWCKNCSIISYFKQIPTNSLAYYDDDFNFEGQNMIIESDKDCKFCGKLIYKTSLLYEKLKICSDCYPISYEFIMSSTTEETIPIFYLPWWDTFYVCVRCKANLLSGGANQKWCSYCFIIYSGCRYCLTTNIIFGLTCQTHCKKCKRVTPIFMGNTIVNIGSNEIDDFVYKKRNIVNDLKNIYMKDIDNYDDNPLNVYDFFKEKLCVKSVSEAIIEWIPYSRITNLKEIAKGDFGIIYKATWLDGGICDGTGYSRKKNETVAIKRFIDSINHKRNLLNELKSYYQYGHIIRYYGITKDLETNEYMLVMKYENLLISITRKEKLENVSKESEVDKINEKSHSKVTYSMNSSNLREVEDNFIFEFPKKKRSPNAFIIYRKEIANEIIKASPNIKAKEMSRIVTESWRNLTPNERNKYYKLAEEANRHDERKIKKTIKQKKEHPYKLEFDAHFSEEGDKSSSPSNIINTVEIPSDTNLIHIDTHDNLKFNIFSDDISSLAFFD